MNNLIHATKRKRVNASGIGRRFAWCICGCIGDLPSLRALGRRRDPWCPDGMSRGDIRTHNAAIPIVIAPDREIGPREMRRGASIAASQNIPIATRNGVRWLAARVAVMMSVTSLRSKSVIRVQRWQYPTPGIGAR